MRFLKTTKGKIIILSSLSILILIIVISTVLGSSNKSIKKINSLPLTREMKKLTPTLDKIKKYTIKGSPLIWGLANKDYQVQYITIVNFPTFLSDKTILSIEPNSTIVMPFKTADTINLTSGPLPIKNCITFKLDIFTYVYDLKIQSGKLVFLLSNSQQTGIVGASGGNENINILYKNK